MVCLMPVEIRLFRVLLCVLNCSLSDEVEAIQTLIKKFVDVPMSLADACLVRMSELADDSAVFTLDSDFHVYRKKGRQKIDLIVP